MLREQVRRAKEDGKTEFRNSDGFLNELCNCYNNGFQECLHQVKALHPSLDVSQVSLDNVARSPTRTVNQEDTDEILMVDPMPNIQVDGEAAPEDEQVKSIGDENRPIGEVDEPEKFMDEETLVDQPQCFFVKFIMVPCFYFYFIVETLLRTMVM